MKESSIIFSAPMVQAILDGRKTQTRRVLKRDKVYNGFAFDDPRIARACPYGQPGDRLWVRETYWQQPYSAEVIYRADDPGVALKWFPSIFMPRALSRITLEIVAVRVERLQAISEADAMEEGIEIDPHEAGSVRLAGGGAPVLRTSYVTKFISLWDSINAKRGYSWASNPWVFVVSFNQVDPNGWLII